MEHVNESENQRGETGIAMNEHDEHEIAGPHASRHVAVRHLNTIYWAGVLIWAGLVFGAERLGYLPRVGQADAWSWVFFGAGLYGLLGAIWRTGSRRYPNPKTWDWIWAGILIVLGIGGSTSADITWPLIILLVGVALLASALFRRRRV
jgi:hypothetical protein